ncbi:hypothetical protein [Rhodococcus sp. HNM0569]|uniref:hypothetical protein n=1 Tax=Rhodococcus sp. HNM0569 TaxID=2716340 RepID=UPI00146A2619|nr:hypothetical protein [Rhodococcus sp. HNM0569]NLU81990.1 hypothetical protein [Rhodococcus sp. HNM0569]
MNEPGSPVPGASDPARTDATVSSRHDRSAFVAIGVAVLAVVVTIATVGVLALRGLPTDGLLDTIDGAPVAAPDAVADAPAPEGDAEVPSDPLPAGDPVLRDLPAGPLFGPAWTDDDDTYTMTFDGWPFAFRTAGDVNCFAGSLDELPDARGWPCRAPGGAERVALVLQKCPTDCSAPLPSDFGPPWLDDPAAALRPDDRTAYTENSSDERGRYAVDLVRFVAGTPGGAPEYRLGVYAYAPADDADRIRRTLTDIVTQTG